MSNEKYVKRFSKFIVIAHWTNAISFIMLVLTGLPLFLGVKLPDFLQIVHRVFAVTFLLGAVMERFMTGPTPGP